MSTRMPYKLRAVDTAQEAVFYGQFKAVIPTATGRSGISTQLISWLDLDTSQLNNKSTFVGSGQY